MSASVALKRCLLKLSIDNIFSKVTQFPPSNLLTSSACSIISCMDVRTLMTQWRHWNACLWAFNWFGETTFWWNNVNDTNQLVHSERASVELWMHLGSGLATLLPFLTTSNNSTGALEPSTNFWNNTPFSTLTMPSIKWMRFGNCIWVLWYVSCKKNCFVYSVCQLI